MGTARRLLQSAFGFLALVFICAACLTLSHLPHFFARLLTYDLSTDSFEGASQARRLTFVVLRGLGLLIMCAPIPLSALYSTTWWTLHKGKPSGRGWGLAASIITVLQGIPFLALTIRYWNQIHGMGSEGFLILIGLPLVVGIPGIIAFAPRKAAQPLAEPEPLPIKGDGTSRSMDRFAILIQVAVILLGGQLGWHWARSRFGNPIAGSSSWLLWIAELAVVVALHELGHIVAGLASGMRLGGVLFGPLHFYQFDGKWKFRFQGGLFSAAAGAVKMIPRTAYRRRGAQICFIAGGPVASLLSGLVFVYCATTIPNGQSEILWDFCSWTGIFSLSVFVLNIIPVRSQAYYSDGAKIYQALTRSVLDDYCWILSLSSSVSVTPNRPRDYDLAALRRVIEAEVGRPQRAVFCLMESECLLERGHFDESARSIADAQTAYEQQSEKLTAGAICAFVFGHAILRSDPATAHVWAERLEASFGFSSDDRWFCAAALACAEGRKKDAEGALDEFERFQHSRRRCGSREFSLFLAGLMREKLSGHMDVLVPGREAVSAPTELVQQSA